MSKRKPKTVVSAGHNAGDSQTRRRRWSVPQLVSIVGALIGTIIVVYAPAADWFARLGQNEVIHAYTRTTKATSSAQLEQMLEEARQYNKRLPIVNMIDPYGEDAEQFTGDPAERALYEKMMNLGDGEPLGWLSIGSADITMPIYHGTAASTLMRGAGHLFGSSLPVGGESTRAIITGHSGDPRAKLFTKLHDVKVGDTFAISALGEDLYYRVRDVRIIEPEEVEGLNIERGKDLVTLITCTPIGVNTHRLVVTGERIPHPAYQDTKEYPMDAEGLSAGFPWWIIPLVVVPTLAGWISRPAGARKPRPKAEKSE